MAQVRNVISAPPSSTVPGRAARHHSQRPAVSTPSSCNADINNSGRLTHSFSHRAVTAGNVGFVEHIVYSHRCRPFKPRFRT